MLVVLSVVEGQLDAVREVLAGASVTEVAASAEGVPSVGPLVAGSVPDGGGGRPGGPVASSEGVSAPGAGGRRRWARCAGTSAR